MSPLEPRFERLRLLGEGATGRVELARLLAPLGDLPGGSEVAVKTLRDPADEEGREAFLAEVEAGSRCADPSLACVLAHGEDEEGRPYLVLQYVPGRSLREALADGPLPEPLVRSVGAQLAGALATLHAAEIVHGDVKPENVRIDDEGRAVLLDLGFARRIEDDDGRTRGSLAYLSPERARGELGSEATPAADVFALGVVLYELLTGVHPFGVRVAEAVPFTAPAAGLGSTSGRLLSRSLVEEGGDVLLAALAEARYVPPSHLDLNLSPFVDQLLETVLARDPARRPPADELSERLRAGEASGWWRRRVDAALREPAHLDRPGRHLAPLVGRERELLELTEAFAEVRAGATRVHWVSGPEGCGKWRLVTGFAERMRTAEEPPFYLYARWNDEAEALPGGALLVLLHRWLRLPLSSSASDAERSVLAELVGPRRAETMLAALEKGSGTGRERDFVPAAVATWLRALAEGRPLIVFLDDLQRAGPVTREALYALFGELGGTPVHLILGVREDVPASTEPLERLRAHAQRLAETREAFGVRELTLGPLDRTGMRELVDAIFDRSVPRGRLAEVLWLRSRGNPGLATEILYELVADGRASRKSGRQDARLLLHVTPDQLPLPRSLAMIVSDRIAATAPEERLWLERISVVGGRIDPDFLLRAFPPTKRSELDQVLSQLVHRGWLVPVANRYRFARPALRESIYRALGDRRRKNLHLAAARGLLPEDGRQLGTEEAFQRAFHLRQADEHGEVLVLVLELLAGERRRVSARRLLTLARWGLEALEQSTPIDRGDYGRVRLELLEVGADAADRLGHRAEERALLDFIIDLDLDLAEYPAEGARLYLLHARYASGTGNFGLARGMLKNAVELARASGQTALISESLRRLSQAQGQIGELADARVLAREALDSAQGANQHAVARLALAQVDVLEDRLEVALGGIETAVRELRGTDAVRPGVAAYANLLRARVWRSLGRPARALGAARRAVALARRTGERRLEAEARARLGGLLLDLDRPQDAEVELRDAQLLADEIEDRRGQVLARVWLGLLLWEEDHAEACGMIERGVALAHEIAFSRAEAFGLALLSRVWGEQDPTRADGSSAEAVRLLDRHGAELVDRIVIAGTRGLVLRELGRDRDARTVMRTLEKRVRRSVGMTRDKALGADQRTYTERLLAAVTTFEGHVLPRLTRADGS